MGFPLVTFFHNDLSFFVDDGPFAVLLNTGKAFGEVPHLVINARNDYLSLGVDKAPFAVLLDTGKAFIEVIRPVEPVNIGIISKLFPLVKK